jgi:integrase
MTRRRSPWGSVRRLRSGRYQARYRVDGANHVAPRTFRTKREADAFLARTRAELERGAWADPEAGKVPLAEYAWRWLDERPNLRRRTQELYEGLLRLHVLSTLGDTSLIDLSPATIRTWHAGLLKRPKPGASTAAKSYRLLRSILATAVEDELITRNPCTIKGAGIERPKERPIATIEQIYALAEIIEPRYRALVLTATFTGLRLGELRALTRRRLDLLHATVHVVEQMSELKHAELVIGPPKSEAGKRTVAIPAALIPELEAHLGCWSAPGPDGFVFCGTREPADPPSEPVHGVAPSCASHRLRGAAVPRPATHRQHARCRHRREHQGAHGPPGSRLAAGRADLPARDRRARPGDSGGLERADQRCRRKGCREGNGAPLLR